MFLYLLSAKVPNYLAQSIIAVYERPRFEIVRFDLEKQASHKVKAVRILEKQILTFKPELGPRPLQLSPKGDQVAVVFQSAGQVLIFRTRDLRLKADLKLKDAFGVQWSPNEKKIIVSGVWQDSLVDLATRKAEPLPAGQWPKFWSLDGKEIYYRHLSKKTFRNGPVPLSDKFSKLNVRTGRIQPCNERALVQNTVFRYVPKPELSAALSSSILVYAWGADGFMAIGSSGLGGRPAVDLYVSRVGVRRLQTLSSELAIDTISWVNPFTVAYLGSPITHKGVEGDSDLSLYDVRTRVLSQFGITWREQTESSVAVPRPH